MRVGRGGRVLPAPGDPVLGGGPTVRRSPRATPAPRCTVLVLERPAAAGGRGARAAGTAGHSPKRPRSPAATSSTASRSSTCASSRRPASAATAGGSSGGRGGHSAGAGARHEQKHSTWCTPLRAAVGRGGARLHAARAAAARDPVHGGDVLGPLVSTPAARAVARCWAGRASCCATASGRRALRRADRSAERMTVVHLGADAGRTDVKHPQTTIATLAHLIPRNATPTCCARWRCRRPPARAALARDRRRSGAPRAERLAARARRGRPRPIRGPARGRGGAHPSSQAAGDGAAKRGRGVRRGVRGGAGPGRAGDRLRGRGRPRGDRRRGDGMLLVAPRDPEALAEANRAVCSSSSERLEGAQLAARRATAAASFTWERCG